MTSQQILGKFKHQSLSDALVEAENLDNFERKGITPKINSPSKLDVQWEETKFTPKPLSNRLLCP